MTPQAYSAAVSACVDRWTRRATDLDRPLSLSRMRSFLNAAIFIQQIAMVPLPDSTTARCNALRPGLRVRVRRPVFGRGVRRWKCGDRLRQCVKVHSHCQHLWTSTKFYISLIYTCRRRQCIEKSIVTTMLLCFICYFVLIFMDCHVTPTPSWIYKTRICLTMDILLSTNSRQPKNNIILIFVDWVPT